MSAPGTPARPATASVAAPVGVLGGVAEAAVDAAGTMQLAGVELQWWIGAADRWHRPAQEIAVRQELLDGAPVVQTSVRVPGGDARARTYGVVHDGAEWLVLEVHNDSRTPVALAVVSTALAADGRWEHEGPALRRDGVVLTMAARTADAVLGGDDVGAVAAELERSTLEPAGGQSGSAGTGSAAGSGSSAGAILTQRTIAQVFALAHTTGIRLLVNAAGLVGSSSGGPGTAGALGTASGPASAGASPASVANQVNGAPAAEAVIRGWRRQLDARCRLGLGDDDGERALFERRCRLLLSAAATPADISALAGLGHHDEAASRLNGALSTLRSPVDEEQAAGLLVAAADVVSWCVDPDDAEQLAELLRPVLVELAGWSGRDASAQSLALWALTRGAGRSGAVQPGAGRSGAGRSGARRAGAARGWGRERDGRGGSAALDAGTRDEIAEQRERQTAGDGDGAALLQARRQLVIDDDASTLVLLDGWRPTWRGRSFDVHGLPTAHGALSFALRWHGARPALLWQLDLGAGAPVPRLVCPALDAGFDSTVAVGEVLLAEPPAG